MLCRGARASQYNSIRSMAIAFLTGGTGFLGGHVARALCDAGWSVRLLARSPQRAGGGLLADLPVSVVAGDLSDEERLARALEGADAIVHVAGLVKARSLADYRDVNVEATRRLLRAGARAAPRAAWVHVSSQAAAGPAREGRPVAEGDESRPISWYGLSKREGEIAVADGWKGSWTVLRPGVVYGAAIEASSRTSAWPPPAGFPLPAGRTRIQVIARGARRARHRAGGVAARARWARRGSCATRNRCASRSSRARSRRSRRGEPASSRCRTPRSAFSAGEQTLLEILTRRSRPFNADKAREVLAGDWLCDGAPMAEALGAAGAEAARGGPSRAVGLVSGGRLAAVGPSCPAGRGVAL